MDDFSFEPLERISPDARRQRRWRMLNPERNRRRNQIEAQNYRARKLGAPGRLSLEGWQSVLIYYGGRCLCCDRDDVLLTIDHIIPLERGGSNTLDNTQPLCFPCNRSKGTKTTDYRIALEQDLRGGVISSGQWSVVGGQWPVENV